MQPNQNKLTIDEKIFNHQGFKVADDILCRQVENEAILLHITGGMYYSLNETSVLFWEALQNQEPFEPVVDKITNEYEVERSQVLRDLQVFIEDLLKYRLIFKTSD